MAINLLAVVAAFLVACIAVQFAKPLAYEHTAGPELDLLTPTPELKGVWEPNNKLQASTKLAEGQVRNLETVCFDALGRMFGTSEDGNIMVFSPDKSKAEVWTYVGGRPFGCAIDKQGDMWVCNTVMGLQKIDHKTRQIVTVVNYADGRPINHANDLDIAEDGKIYFTDATRFGPARAPNGLFPVVDAINIEMYEANNTGRLLEYDPETRNTRLVLGGLLYGNGVTVSHDQQSVLVAVSFTYRVHRCYVKGSKKGQCEVVTRLDAVADGISRASKGGYWVAVCSPPLPSFVTYQTVRTILARLPAWMAPPPVLHGIVARISEDGEVLETLQDAEGKVARFVSSATEHKGALYLGSMAADYVASYKLS
eukprot:NODE_2104_length_1296_cov_24.379310_g1915_i0.p1 GENE.NODE_2104_length_1296_cov_24.379310_g1915_i0~~NODE_2104_length_1296_cov_24.379310_g1915_i0.p1  ORF type:complete len:383 (-),score=77.82 NODE_2104_length_1296_cov_24.379310_g1915_i0:147-1247(-)